MCRVFFSFLLFLSVAGMHSAKAAGTEDTWLFLKRSELVHILSQGSESTPPTVRTLKELLDSHRPADTPAAERAESKALAEMERMAPDSIWVMHGSELPFWVTMAGDDERIHSLRILMPVVKHSEEESRRAFETLSALFAALHPGSPDAANWPEESFRTAWENYPLWYKNLLPDPDDVFVRLTTDGVTSSTFGVPPNIVVYDITVREICIPMTASGNPFEHYVC
ncbi:hypothetical protein [Pelagibius marinus]|uniref:hypothetical protein n=1 Tax=Pelagibius marinus TaxID=2762760 RepID=UPI001872697A|nr:hypothetical protein [Pelagibius marinus]